MGPESGYSPQTDQHKQTLTRRQLLKVAGGVASTAVLSQVPILEAKAEVVNDELLKQQAKDIFWKQLLGEDYKEILSKQEAITLSIKDDHAGMGIFFNPIEISGSEQGNQVAASTIEGKFLNGMNIATRQENLEVEMIQSEGSGAYMARFWVRPESINVSGLESVLIGGKPISGDNVRICIGEAHYSEEGSLNEKQSLREWFKLFKNSEKPKENKEWEMTSLSGVYKDELVSTWSRIQFNNSHIDVNTIIAAAKLHGIEVPQEPDSLSILETIDLLSNEYFITPNNGDIIAGQILAGAACNISSNIDYFAHENPEITVVEKFHHGDPSPHTDNDPKFLGDAALWASANPEYRKDLKIARASSTPVYFATHSTLIPRNMRAETSNVPANEALVSEPFQGGKTISLINLAFTKDQPTEKSTFDTSLHILENATYPDKMFKEAWTNIEKNLDRDKKRDTILGKCFTCIKNQDTQ